MKKVLLFMLPVIALLASCKSDRDGNGGIDQPPAGEQWVDITFTPPSMSTRAPITSEDNIATVDVLVFKRPSGGLDPDASTFQYSRYAFETYSGSNIYRASLKADSDLDLYFAINVRDFVDELIADDEIVADMTWSAVRSKLVMAYSDAASGTGQDNAYELSQLNYSLNDGLPMWGHTYGVALTINDLNKIDKVTLLRSIASVDAVIATTAKFELLHGYVSYAATNGYVPYDATKLDSDFDATSAFVPTTMATTVDIVAAATSNSVANKLYMFENDAPTTARTRTKLILRGYYDPDNNTTKATYYPIALRYGDTDPSAGDKAQVLRNRKFDITINAVYGHGFNTLEEAKNAEELDILDFDVVEWNREQSGNYQVRGDLYLWTPNNKTITHYSKAGDEKTYDFDTNIEFDYFELELRDSDGTVNSTYPVLNSKLTVENDRFRVELLKRTEGTVTIPYLKFTTKATYAAGQTANAGQNPSYLYMKVFSGSWTHEFMVRQLASSGPNDWDDGGEIPGDL